MSEIIRKLKSPPIVEAVVDIDCDLPPLLDLAALEESARNAYRDQYPQFQKMFFETLKIESTPEGPPTHKSTHKLQSLQFLHEDKKQLVQMRAQGYSFNRLAPYSTLDDYLPEIERTWNLFVGISAPTLIRAVRLRYINRFLLPMPDENLELAKYLKVSPQLPDGCNLIFGGFLNQYSAEEKETGNHANIVLTTQPVESGNLPLILDIGAMHPENKEVDNWLWIVEKIQSLRSLKNCIFFNTLTETCINRFQH